MMFKKTYTANAIDKNGILRGCLFTRKYFWISPSHHFYALGEEAKAVRDDISIVDFRRVK